MEGIGGVYETSDIVTGAYERAAAAHAGGGSKGFDHPLAVARKLAENSYGEPVVAAGLLHDTVEDSEADLGELRDTFGGEVSALVDALTEDETISDWEERKAAHRQQVSGAGSEAAAIYAADKLAGIAELRRAYAEKGEAAAERLTAPSLDARIRAWEADADMLEGIEPRLGFLPELRAELNALEAQRQAAAARS